MKHILSLLCEEIRHEIFDQTTLVGVYGAILKVPKLPHRLGRLLFYQRWLLEEGSYEVSFELAGPDGSVLVSPKPTRSVIDKPIELSNIVFGMEGLEVKAAGPYFWRVTLTSGSEETKTEFKIEVAEAPDVFKRLTIRALSEEDVSGK